MRSQCDQHYHVMYRYEWDRLCKDEERKGTNISCVREPMSVSCSSAAVALKRLSSRGRTRAKVLILNDLASGHPGTNCFTKKVSKLSLK